MYQIEDFNAKKLRKKKKKPQKRKRMKIRMKNKVMITKELKKQQVMVIGHVK